MFAALANKIVKVMTIPLSHWFSPDALLTRDIAIDVPAASGACFE
jgi:hypothetical protein